MSIAQWCDLGNHPFPQGQRGSTTIQVEEYVKNQWGGTQPTAVVKDVCAACADDQGLNRLKPDVSDEQALMQARAIRARSGGRTPNPKADGKTYVVDSEEYKAYMNYLEKGITDGREEGSAKD